MLYKAKIGQKLYKYDHVLIEGCPKGEHAQHNQEYRDILQGSAILSIKSERQQRQFIADRHV